MGAHPGRWSIKTNISSVKAVGSKEVGTSMLRNQDVSDELDVRPARWATKNQRIVAFPMGNNLAATNAADIVRVLELAHVEKQVLGSKDRFGAG